MIGWQIIMFDIIIELLTNLFQSIMFVGFLFLFFNKLNNIDKKSIWWFIVFSILSFLYLCCFTFLGNYIIINQTIGYIVLLEFYAVCLLKGALFGRIFVPASAVLINTVISFLFSYFISYVTGQTHFELVTQPTYYRYLCIIVINLTNLVVFSILINLKNKIKILKIADIIAFIIIPFLAISVIYSTLYISVLTNYQQNILIHLIMICINIIVITAIIWLLVKRISKENKIEMELMLTQQKTALYESNIIKTNNQIEKISTIKHDMANNLLCLEKLILDGNYDEACKMCNSVTDNLKHIFTPINTENPLLNAVVNVEQEKASAEGISFKIIINDVLMDFKNNSDIVSIIGNLCDNAIDYLKDKNDDKNMSLKILLDNSYYVIICSNKIEDSVIKNNPTLDTTKGDKTQHGKGIGILKALAKKYDGETKFIEKNGQFHAIVMLMRKNLPDKH